MSDISDVMEAIDTLDTLSPGCITFSSERIDGLMNYNISFYHSNFGAGRMITNHSDAASAVSKIEEYVALISGGEIIPSIPQKVTARQMRIALVSSGHSLSTIESTLDGLPEPTRSVALITWEYSNEFHRNNPTLLAMIPMLGLTDTQVDDLFILAATL